MIDLELVEVAVRRAAVKTPSEEIAQAIFAIAQEIAKIRAEHTPPDRVEEPK